MDNQLSMENENFLKYNSLILEGAKAAKVKKKSPSQITREVVMETMHIEKKTTPGYIIGV